MICHNQNCCSMRCGTAARLSGSACVRGRSLTHSCGRSVCPFVCLQNLNQPRTGHTRARTTERNATDTAERNQTERSEGQGPCPGRRAGWLDGSTARRDCWVCVRLSGSVPFERSVTAKLSFFGECRIGPDFTDRPQRARASPLSARSLSRRAAKQKARAPTEASRVFSQHGRSPVGWFACGTRAPHRRR